MIWVSTGALLSYCFETEGSILEFTSWDVRVSGMTAIGYDSVWRALWMYGELIDVEHKLI